MRPYVVTYAFGGLAVSGTTNEHGLLTKRVGMAPDMVFRLEDIRVTNHGARAVVMLKRQTQLWDPISLETVSEDTSGLFTCFIDQDTGDVLYSPRTPWYLPPGFVLSAYVWSLNSSSRIIVQLYGQLEPWKPRDITRLRLAWG